MPIISTLFEPETFADLTKYTTAKETYKVTS